MTVRLADGRVLVAGGWDSLGGGYLTIKASAEVYDPAAGWTQALRDRHRCYMVDAASPATELGVVRVGVVGGGVSVPADVSTAAAG